MNVTKKRDCKDMTLKNQKKIHSLVTFYFNNFNDLQKKMEIVKVVVFLRRRVNSLLRSLLLLKNK